MKKTRKIIRWVLAILLGLEFLIAGQAKFTSAESWIKRFAGWGYPEPFHIIIGGLEVIGAILLFFPKFTAKAALLLAVIMLGGCVTHLIHGQWSGVIVTLILAALLMVLYFLSDNKPFEFGKTKP